VARQRGDATAAAAFAREGLQISSTAHDNPGMARALRELGALALDRRDLGEAQYLLTESCTTFHAMGSPWVYGRSRSLLVRLEVQQGGYAAARQGCAELLRLVRGGAAIMLPEAAYGLALVLVAEGDEPGALAVLNALADSPGEHATLALIARLRADLERRLEPAQRAAAEQLAGARKLLPWGEELCARPSVVVEAQAPAAFEDSAPSGPAGALVVAETGETLSQREVEVLRLVARGASNPDIAARLIISPHTVKRHVANICQKLGVATRTEAALRALALGIAG
jgi:ATP/maltotriose-dependent transcriptional regulator MalT